MNDVQTIDRTYNRRYLKAEYDLAHSSAIMAARWEEIAGDGDRYLLQYRTAGDGKVRPDHAALNGITLPPSDPFWQSFFPPNGWGCRCTAVQVRRGKYPLSDHNDAMQRGEQALAKDKKGIFRFNPGQQRTAFPDYNPYTISKCRNCNMAKGKAQLAKHFIPDNELCEACRVVRQCELKRTETIHHGKGTVEISNLVNRTDNDFERLMQVAEFFAKKGSHVVLTPKMTRPPKFDYDCIYGDLRGTRYEGKCPDLKIDGLWYEHEGFVTDNPKRAFSNMINHGLKQSDRIIIDRPDLTEFYMERGIRNRIRQGIVVKEGHVDILHGDFVLKIDGWTFCMVKPAFSAHGR